MKYFIKKVKKDFEFLKIDFILVKIKKMKKLLLISLVLVGGLITSNNLNAQRKFKLSTHIAPFTISTYSIPDAVLHSFESLKNNYYYYSYENGVNATFGAEMWSKKGSLYIVRVTIYEHYFNGFNSEYEVVYTFTQDGILVH